MEQARRWIFESRAGLMVIALAYLLPRLLVGFLHVTPTSDADYYFHRAGDLAAGLGYLSAHGAPTAYWPPGWPMALSVVFRLVGGGVTAVWLINLLAGAATAWFTLDLGRHMFGSETVARLGVLLLAFYPNNIAYFPLALTEAFYTALLTGGCWLLIARRRWHATLLAGLVFGAASLVKTQTLLVVPIILALDVLRGTSIRATLPVASRRFALVIATALLLVTPWSLRNAGVLGHYVFVSTNGGITLLTGNNDSARGGFTPDDAVVRRLDARGLGELANDAEAKQLGMAWIAAHPARFVALMPLKLMRLWGPDGEAQWAYETGLAHYDADAGLFRLLRLFNQAYYGLIVLAGIATLAIRGAMRPAEGQRRIDWWLLPYGIGGYISLIAVVFSGQSRFHYPAMPFLCLSAGWLIAWAARRAMAQRLHIHGAARPALSSAK